MKAAARMTSFPPSERRVTVLLPLSRCQYAQLAQQRFAPPRGWRLPPPGHPGLGAAERGLKLTAGERAWVGNQMLGDFTRAEGWPHIDATHGNASVPFPEFALSRKQVTQQQTTVAPHNIWSVCHITAC